MDFVDAECYCRSNRLPVRWGCLLFEEEFAQMNLYSNRDLKMCDMGCGTGETTSFVADLVGANYVLGLDKNENFLQYAREKYVTKSTSTCIYEFENVDLNIAKTKWLKPEWLNTFDLIISSFTLHWLNDLEQALAVQKEMLKIDGELCHVVALRPGEAFMKLKKTVESDPKWMNYIKAFHRETMWQKSDSDMSKVKQEVQREKLWFMDADPVGMVHNILSSLDLQPIDIRLVKVQAVTTREEAKNMLEWLFPHVQAIPITMKKEFMNYVMDVYECHCEYEPESENIVWRNQVKKFILL